MKIKFFDENLLGQKGLCRYMDPEINWDREATDYDVAIYTDRMCFNQPIDDTKNNYAWIIEPPIINGENYINIVNSKNKFKKIFTHIRSILERAENSVYIPHGGTWLRDEDVNLHEKTKNVSFIFSNKDWNPYHRMRQRIWENMKNDNRIDFYGTGSNNPLHHKIDGLKDYRFSIVIENSIEDLYFTEKILDCFLSGTIPVYVGSKKIVDIFDENGIIFFEGSEDIPNILETLTEELYLSKKESIKNNFEISKNYIHPEKQIQNLIEKDVQ